MYNAEASKFGGTMSVGYILLNIDKEGTPSTKLGPKMGIEPRSLTRTLKMMEREELIVRKADTLDKRLVKVYLTHKGRLYRETSKQVVLNLNKYLQQHLAPAEWQSFLAQFERVNQLLDNYTPQTEHPKTTA